MLSILRDVLLTVKFDNKERLKQIVMEEKAGLEFGLAPAGHRFANMRLRSQFGGTGYINDQTKGIGYLFALRESDPRLIKMGERAEKVGDHPRDLDQQQDPALQCDFRCCKLENLPTTS